MRRSHQSWLKCIALAAILVSLPGRTDAAHNDTITAGLTVTVTDVNPDTLTVTYNVTFTGRDSSALPYAIIGTKAFLDSSIVTWDTPVVPAVDFGDGNTLATLTLPFTSSFTGPNSQNMRRAKVTGLTHVYAAPGNYTITVFGGNVYPSNSYNWGSYPGNTVTADTVSLDGAQISDTYAYGVTNTASVEIAAPVPAFGSASAVLALLLGLLLAAAGLRALRAPRQA